MGKPIICPRCATRNGLLHEECRQCGGAISLSGNIFRAKYPGSYPPSAIWRTQNIHYLWRNASPINGPKPDQAEHDFLRYCLLLRAMQERFDKDDKHWFDDALFFLRGGYEFFSHLNTTSNMTLRGTIFGGLNHSRRPKVILGRWLEDFINEAQARNRSNLDVFIADEINSGNGVRRILKVIYNHLNRSNHHALNMSITFIFYMACTDDTTFDEYEFKRTIKKRRHYKVGNLNIYNHFRLFKGPILTYDSEKYSGLKVKSSGLSRKEKYSVIKYNPGYFNLICPITKGIILDFGTTSSMANITGTLVLELLGNLGDISYKKMDDLIKTNGCKECRKLYKQLRRRCTRFIKSKRL